MDAQFWINAWNEGRTNFHQSGFNDQLLRYFPGFNPKEGQSVLVPLCGKTKDMVWLHDLKLKVHGVELHEDAVRSFFKENALEPYKESQNYNFTTFKFQNITISSGDFFKLPENQLYDFIYDRASLVALPVQMRKDYVEIIKKSLRPGGKYLLIVYEYDQSKMAGPPFSIDEKEIHNLYQSEFKIELIESSKPPNEGPRLAALKENLQQHVYILEKMTR